MKNFIKILPVMALIVFTVSSCKGVSPDADEEGVLIEKPWFFGHGGVDTDAVESGLSWIAWSTDVEYFKIVPYKHQVDMDDLFSDDNTPLDFHTIIITEIKKGKSPILLQNYGKDWFNTNLYNYSLHADSLCSYRVYKRHSKKPIDYIAKDGENLIKELVD